MDSVHNYEDILNIERPEFNRHPKMSAADRAAQFMPFAALSGYASVIQETARTTESRIILDNSEIQKINKKLNIIKLRESSRPKITIRYYQPDKKKKGGAYLSVTKRVSRVDEYSQTLKFTDESAVPFSDIVSIKLQTENE